MKNIVDSDWAPKDKKEEAPIEEKKEIKYLFNWYIDNLDTEKIREIEFSNVNEILSNNNERNYFKSYIVNHIKENILIAGIKRSDEKTFSWRCTTYFHIDDIAYKICKFLLDVIQYEEKSLDLIGTKLIDRYLDMIYESMISNMFNACRVNIPFYKRGELELKAPSVKRLPTQSAAEWEELRKNPGRLGKRIHSDQPIENPKDLNIVDGIDSIDVGKDFTQEVKPMVTTRKLMEEMESLDKEVRDHYKRIVKQSGDTWQIREVDVPKEFVGADTTVRQKIRILENIEEEPLVPTIDIACNPNIALNEIRT